MPVPARAELDPEPLGELRAPAYRVSSRARWYWAVRALPGWVVVLGIEALVLVTTGASATLWAAIMGGSGLVALLHVTVMPQWRFRVHRWEESAQAVYTQSGWITQERRIAPISRIQTVDTQRGPFEQLFGLTNVTVTTASAAGPLHIRGLDRLTAERLVHELTTRTRSIDDAT
jgi:membrane protein YdbS with pleckstrin-like domain